MTQYTLQEKVQFTEHIVNELNKFWIKYKGDLFNHKDCWDETLHSFTNEDWEILMDAMEAIRIEDARCYIPYSQQSFDDVRKVLMVEGHDGNPKALDARKHKKTAFRALMHVKDVFNNFTGYEPPTKFPKDPEPPTPFEQLFERE